MSEQVLYKLPKPILIRNFSSVKTRIQVQSKRRSTDPETDEAHYAGTLDAIQKIVKDEGFLGLYSGINGSLIGVASTNFAYFYWYSVIRTLYISSQSVPKPHGTIIELALGAAAGAVAQVCTIPVAVITTRQQTQPRRDRKGLLDTGREVVHSEDGWSGLWRGLKASLVLVVNPAVTYAAYQRLKDVMFPGRTVLRPWEAFSMIDGLIPFIIVDTKFHSAGRHVEVFSNGSDPAINRCQGRPSISTTARTE